MRLAAVLALLFTLVACPSAKAPTGAAPEYEDPPAPSWIDGGGGAAPDAALAADAAPAAIAPQ